MNAIAIKYVTFLQTVFSAYTIYKMYRIRRYSVTEFKYNHLNLNYKYYLMRNEMPTIKKFDVIVITVYQGCLYKTQITWHVNKIQGRTYLGQIFKRPKWRMQQTFFSPR